MTKTTGRCIVNPKGEAFFCEPGQEHFQVCEKVVKARGEPQNGYDASEVLENEGWVRVSGYGMTTPATFNRVRQVTQAQRDTIFDVAVTQMEAGNEWGAQTIMKELNEVPE
jgi:hypothetical protein